MSNKWVVVLTVVIAIVVVLFVFRGQFGGIADKAVVNDLFVEHDDDDFSPGPEIGSQLPTIHADYQGVSVRDLAQFSGERGLVVMLNRSIDWCGFCKRQAMEVNEHISKFAENDLGLVMLVYDSPAIRDSFVSERGIDYPILADINVESIKALDVLNTDFVEGDDAYGIPTPGTIISTPDGRVVGKLFLEPYSKRISSTAILAKALEWLPSAAVASDAAEGELMEDGTLMEGMKKMEGAKEEGMNKMEDAKEEGMNKMEGAKEEGAKKIEGVKKKMKDLPSLP